MAQEQPIQLGPILYPLGKTAYGVLGFFQGALIGTALGGGVSLFGSLVGGLYEGVAQGSVQTGFREAISLLPEIGIPIASLVGVIAGVVRAPFLLDEFNRDFKRKVSARRR